MEQEDVLSYMFTLLAHQKTFIIACQLIEDMLQSKKILLDLNKISEYVMSYVNVVCLLFVLFVIIYIIHYYYFYIMHTEKIAKVNIGQCHSLPKLKCVNLTN